MDAEVFDIKPWYFDVPHLFFLHAAALGLSPAHVLRAMEEGCFHGKGSDVERDLPLLWAATRLLAPADVVELGVRHGMTSKTLASALMVDTDNGNFSGGFLHCYDPDPRCEWHLQQLFGESDYDYIFHAKMGEEAWKESGKQIIDSGGVDMLMIDTDPHTFDQTMGWLETWVLQGLKAPGLAVFHDIQPARPEIQVEDAILKFCKAHQAGWRYVPFHTPGPYTYQYGLGFLWRLPR